MSEELKEKVEKTEEEKLRDKIKQQEATIGALKGMMGQLVPVVEVILPLLKERPEIDKKLTDQVERMVQISNMLIKMGDEDAQMPMQANV